ncbi:MAG: apolipoprotein N-acyltransferase [Alphaproteobacteria bacterium]|nr:apolipoprotein N-acyltransferase [Alphaproteobacteria bacterium]
MIKYLEKILDGKKYRFAIFAFIFGAFSTYALAPFHLTFTLFIGLSALYLLLTMSSTNFRAAMTGYCFGLGYFGFGLSWIANALLVEGNEYAWLWPIAVAGLPLGLSFFTAFACYLSKKMLNLRHVSGYIGFILFMFSSEILRGYIFTGFPWNLFGYIWAENLEIIQIVHLWNIYLLTGLTLFWCSAPGFVIISENKTRYKIIIICLAFISFSGNYIYGLQRLAQNPTQYSENVKFILIQPNIKQSEKWKSDKILDHFSNQLATISKSLLQEKDGHDIYVVLPETAFPPFVMEHPKAKESIANSLSVYQGNVFLIAGVLRYKKEENSYFNSIVMFGKNAEIIDIYDKHHLVPFGEYIPFDNIFSIAPIVGFSGFKAGLGPKTVKTRSDFSYIPAICYEAIFPRSFSGKNNAGQLAMVNVTNDAWYGESAGPYQHSAQVKFRAIEQNTPLIRVANTGITALYDPFGRALKVTDMHEDVVISHLLPLPNKRASNP